VHRLAGGEAGALQFVAGGVRGSEEILERKTRKSIASGEALRRLLE
jgi:8-oxo-dGTP pyrophosphatase MutT (NUDIX family)